MFPGLWAGWAPLELLGGVVAPSLALSAPSLMHPLGDFASCLIFLNTFIFRLDEPELSPTVYREESGLIQLASLKFSHDPPLRPWSFVPPVKKPGKYSRNNSQKQIPMLETHGNMLVSTQVYRLNSVSIISFLHPLLLLGLVEKLCWNPNCLQISIH